MLAKIMRAKWKNAAFRAKQKKSRKHYKTEAYRAKLRAAHLGKGKFSGLDRASLQNFIGCHNRVRIGKARSVEWPRTREGYVAFMKEIGPKPNDGQKWSVGRKDHKKGYTTGNVEWQTHAYNSSEPRKRKTK